MTQDGMTFEQFRQRYAGVAGVLVQFFQDRADTDLLDSLEAIDHGIRNAWWHRDEIAPQFRELACEATSEEQLGNWMHNLGMHELVGLFWFNSSLCEMIARRAELWVARGVEPPVTSWRNHLPRTSAWTDDATRDRTVATVLERHESVIERWMADPAGQPRLCFSVDVGEPVGTVEHTVSDHRGELTYSGPATRAVVTVAQKEDRNRVVGAYPDQPVDPSWAERFPDLGHLFGGWFGQQWPTECHVAWYVFEHLVNEIGQPARARTAEQLADLLTLPEPDAQAAVHHLGSYVVPENTLAFLDRLHWALSAAEAVFPPEPLPGPLELP